VRSLIISDVVGDPLEIIASGPTVGDTSTPQAALEILGRYRAAPPELPEPVRRLLQAKAAASPEFRGVPASVVNHLIGTNATSVDAAADAARELGYEVVSLGSSLQGRADEAGVAHLAQLRSLQQSEETASGDGRRICLLSGGEPVVVLTPTSRPRSGGRNQHLILAALEAAWNDGLDGLVLLSGGTDGEDGPTAAAGAVLDAEILERSRLRGWHPRPFLELQDSCTYLKDLGALLVTGPTHTNVMDLRVGLAVPKIDA
jgi:glycerate-2-kinase